MSVKLPMVPLPPGSPRANARRGPPPPNVILYQPRAPPLAAQDTRPMSARTQEVYTRHFRRTISEAIGELYPVKVLQQGDALNLSQECPTMQHVWVGLVQTKSEVELDLVALFTDQYGYLQSDDTPTILYYGNTGNPTDPVNFREGDQGLHKAGAVRDDQSVQSVVLDLSRLQNIVQIVFVASIQQAVPRHHAFANIQDEFQLVIYEKFNSRYRKVAEAPLGGPRGCTLDPTGTAVEVGAITRNTNGQWEFMVRGTSYQGTLQTIYKSLTRSADELHPIPEGTRANLSDAIPGLRHLNGALTYTALPRRGKSRVSVKSMIFCLSASGVMSDFSDFIHVANPTNKSGSALLNACLVGTSDLAFGASEVIAFDLMALSRSGIKQIIICVAMGEKPQGATFSDIANCTFQFYTSTGDKKSVLFRLCIPNTRESNECNVIELGRLVFLDGNWEILPTQLPLKLDQHQLIAKYRGDHLPLRTATLEPGNVINVSDGVDRVCRVIRIGLAWGKPRKQRNTDALSRQASSKFSRADTFASSSGHSTRAPSTMSFLMDFGTSPGASKRPSRQASRAVSPPMGAAAGNASMPRMSIMKRAGSNGSCLSRAGSFSKSSAQAECVVICRNEQGNLVSRAMYLSYLNRTTPYGEIKLTDKVDGGDDEQLEVDLDKITENRHIHSLAIYLVIYRAEERGHHFGHVNKVSLHMFNHFSGRQLCQMKIPEGTFGEGVTGLCLAKMYRDVDDNGQDQWLFKAEVDPFKKSISELWVEQLPPPKQRLSVGDSFDVSTSLEATTYTLGFGWDLVPSTRQELTQVDIAVLALGADYKLYSDEECATPTNPFTKSISLSGNSRVPRMGRDDNETIDLNLSRVPQEISQLMICYIFPETKEKRSSWRSIQHMYVRLYEKPLVTKTPPPGAATIGVGNGLISTAVIEQDILRFNIPTTKIADDVAAIEVARLIRLDDNTWTFKALYSTRHSNLEEMLKKFKKRPVTEVSTNKDVAISDAHAAASMVVTKAGGK